MTLDFSYSKEIHFLTRLTRSKFRFQIIKLKLASLPAIPIWYEFFLDHKATELNPD